MPQDDLVDQLRRGRLVLPRTRFSGGSMQAAGKLGRPCHMFPSGGVRVVTRGPARGTSSARQGFEAYQAEPGEARGRIHRPGSWTLPRVRPGA
jgi:hypothetical protein